LESHLADARLIADCELDSGYLPYLGVPRAGGNIGITFTLRLPHFVHSRWAGFLHFVAAYVWLATSRLDERRHSCAKHVMGSMASQKFQMRPT
jgi:hypothetical protein